MRIWMLLCLAPVLGAQDSPQVTLRLLDPHPFRQGELISAEVRPGFFPPPPDARPPADRWQFAGILLDPSSTCGTQAQPCLPPPNAFNGLRAVTGYEDIELNVYLPPLAPGRYRVAALARKMVRGKCGPNCYGYAEPPQYATSAWADIEIVAAGAGWARLAISRSVATLSGAASKDRAGYEAETAAARQLALIDDPAAWNASLDLLPRMENVLLPGLARAHRADRVCDLLQARVTAPAQAVSIQYLSTLTDVCTRAHLPPQPPLPGGARPAAAIVQRPLPVQPAAAPDPAMLAWIQKRTAYVADLLRKQAAALAGSLPSKRGEAKWTAYATLLQHVAQMRANRPAPPDPAWLPMLGGEFARDFSSIDPARQQYLLELYASTVHSPDAAPFYESILDRWKPGDYYEAPHSALQALYRVDPARARARIRAELVKDKTWLDEPQLELLPPADVSPMDGALLDALARAQQPGGWNARLRMAAIARYATPRALGRIRAIYESQQDPCQPELAAYFVRVDPAYADRIFHSHPWDMHAPPPRCTVQYFQRTPPLAMSAGLEDYMAAYLMHGDVFVKSTAAKALARYGTPSALPRLWDAFRYFHDYWKGKPDELQQNGESWRLESDLRDAIARGRGWLVSEPDLRLVESLCISGKCIQDTRDDLQEMQSPLVAVEAMPQPAGLFGRVAQYHGLQSLAALEAKMAQYPRGTRFVLYGTADAGIAEELRRFALQSGFVMSDR